jgi:hypothetical protein
MALDFTKLFVGSLLDSARQSSNISAKSAGGGTL